MLLHAIRLAAGVQSSINLLVIPFSVGDLVSVIPTKTSSFIIQSISREREHLMRRNCFSEKCQLLDGHHKIHKYHRNTCSMHLSEGVYQQIEGRKPSRTPKIPSTPNSNRCTTCTAFPVSITLSFQHIILLA